MEDTPERVVHRGNYIFAERYWTATCRICGWFVSDPSRRRARALFREHILATTPSRDYTRPLPHPHPRSEPDGPIDLRLGPGSEGNEAVSDTL